MDPFTTYQLTKALHIISFVCWFAGLFYLPRLMVYQVENPTILLLSTMQHRLLRFIMRPAALATWVFGIALLAQAPYLITQGWLHAKLGLVLVLTAYHGALEYHHLTLRLGRNTHSSRWFRWFNEVPTVLLISIVLLGLLKPF